MEFEEKGIIQQLIEMGLIYMIEGKLQLGQKENIPTPPTKAE